MDLGGQVEKRVDCDPAHVQRSYACRGHDGESQIKDVSQVTDKGGFPGPCVTSYKHNRGIGFNQRTNFLVFIGDNDFVERIAANGLRLRSLVFVGCSAVKFTDIDRSDPQEGLHRLP